MNYYKNSISKFISEDPDAILGILASNMQFDLNDVQRNAWKIQTAILKSSLYDLSGQILFEYTIPRIGKRVDNVLIIDNVVFLIEFKVGESEYHKADINQTLDYALDLKYFQEASQNAFLIPILICTNASDRDNKLELYDDKVAKVLLCNPGNLRRTIDSVLTELAGKSADIDANSWISSRYYPTPTIIEAAQALYANHKVADISRSDSGTYNLSETTETVKDIIEETKRNKQKSIVFITGVPGAGKTLAGINIANEMHSYQDDEHAVFLSGNQPLVSVLQEALARDEVKRDKSIRIGAARRKTQSFIQIIHHYRDEFVNNDKAPTEKVVIFDEAQRAWTKKQIVKFMAQKKGIADFGYSEPEFLISTMDRHNDWACVICLIGGGQEINTGEAGLAEWFNSLRRSFANWQVYVSGSLDDKEYLGKETYDQMIEGLSVTQKSKLHLATSIRSFRSEKLSEFVKLLLDNDTAGAQRAHAQLAEKYPIYFTRDLNTANNWVRERARGDERYGLIASSNALRLKAEGIFVKNTISPPDWFLNAESDVRSSFYLEDVATEFDIQGLELDWSVVAWDLDLRLTVGEWSCHSFTGNRWNNLKNEESIKYLVNSYRVLLTRARQGMIIYIPPGSNADHSRPPAEYDEIAALLREIGLSEL
jgi:hypothetical protein